MSDLVVDVIIRTRDCDQLLGLSLEKLKSLSVNSRVILVDNGSLKSRFKNSILVAEYLRYSLPIFNYAMSINLAIPFLQSEYCLILSSHTHLSNSYALEYAVGFLNAHPSFAGLCFSDNASLDSLSVDQIAAASFNGWNGLWNTASLYRTKLLRERPFNPDCYSSEDQEWSAWALFDKDLNLGHIKGCGLTNKNPRSQSIVKRVREWECISYYSYNRFLEPRFMISILRRSTNMFLHLKMKQSFFWLLVFFALLKCNFVQPIGRSSYY